ncbi:MAG TPA: aromatic ring-hydroxylating dioxygenase subunit alpha, partial [Thermoleophilaceae bacterium]|nr:aromatic ring-hydroxylating dioxygenase subunit alpha [Thermoleophilaceae bacterium]
MRLLTKSGMAVTVTEPAPGLAKQLEPRHYRDPEVTELEQKRIFAKSWQLVAHVSRLPNPGDYLTSTAGTEPVLVLRDEHGELRAFRNVCRHRGSRLLNGSGQCGQAIRCLYHGWTYRTDGELIGVPEGRSIPGLDKSELGLFPARVELLCGLVFVNLDVHAAPLAEQVAGLPERLERYGIERLRPSGAWRGTQPANWKIVIDNYNEGYHVPIAHPGLMRLLDYKHYDVEVHDGWVWFEAPMRDKPSGNPMERAYQKLVSPMPGLDEADRRVWRYAMIYPNTTIDLYPDQVATWRIDPDGPLRSRDESFTYRHPRAGARTRLAQFVNNRVNALVSKEDADLVENVQAGLESRGFELGPLSHREAAIA